MSANKNIDDKDDSYLFIQEKIVPRTKNTKRKFMKYLCFIIILAILFGLISSLVFNVTNHFISGWNQKNTKEPISLDEEEGQEVVQEPFMSQQPGTESGDSSTEKKPEKLDDMDLYNAYGLHTYQKTYTVMRDLSEKCKYFMVTVRATKNITSWFEKGDSREGCGLIISKDKTYIYILCNYSKIEKVDKLEVEFFNEEDARAEYIRYNKETGLALLKVKTSSLTRRTNIKIQKAELGNSYQIGCGMPVLGLGAPDGTISSIAIGYVTAPCINKGITDGILGLYHTNLMENASGEGFFVNMDGKVVGIITHQYKDESDQKILSFLGITKLKPLIQCLLNDKDMAYLGAKISEVSSSDMKKLNVKYGIYVTDIIARSPAFKQGLRAGDVITEVDGSSVSSPSALMSGLAEREAGDEIEFTIMRQTKVEYPKNSFAEKHIKITLG